MLYGINNNGFADTMSSSLQQAQNNNLWPYIMLASVARTRYKGLPTNVVAMSHLYTILASNSFAPSHLKRIVLAWPAILLIARGYGFIKSNLGKHNLTKLANNKATKKLKHHQCLIHHHLLIVLEVNCLHCLCKFEWANWVHMTK